MRAYIVAESASYWGDVETTYAAINGVVPTPRIIYLIIEGIGSIVEIKTSHSL